MTGRLLLAILCCLLSFCLYAQHTALPAGGRPGNALQADSQLHVIDEVNKGADISDKISLLADSSGRYTMAQVAGLSDQFRTDIKPDERNAYYWTKLSLQSKLPCAAAFYLHISSRSEIEVYRQDKNGAITRLAVRELPMSFVPSRYERFVSHLSLQAGESISCFVRLRSAHLDEHELRMVLRPEKEVDNVFTQVLMEEAMLQGVLWVMLLYNLVLFLLVKDRIYLYYVCMVLGSSLYYLGGERLLSWAIQLPDINHLGHVGGAALLHVSILQMTRHYFKTHQHFPRWNRFLQLLILTTICGNLMAHLYHLDYLGYMVINIANVFDLMNLLTILAIGIYMYYNKYPLAGYFLATNTLSVILGVISVSQGPFLGLVIANSFTRLSAKLASLSSAALFAIALAARINLLRREIEQHRQQNQEREKQKLLEIQRVTEEKNRELEQKVQQRTLELMESNEELNQTIEELDALNTALNQTNLMLEDQRKTLLNNHENIIASISYAQRIQQATLDDTEEVANYFRDAFILFLPKDMVSGDFYWFANVRNKKIMVAADCTGHGVPGAFMTVMGINFLDEIVKNQRIVQPDEILYELDRKIISKLQRQSHDIQLDDGMDVTVLAIDELRGVVEFAGAKNPLYYVRQGEMHQLPGSKFSVGSVQFKSSKAFALHSFRYQPGDVFYLFSDGFQDQFGGGQERKYMSKRFREFLLSISRLSMEEQKETLLKELHQWKGQLPQTDDVLVVGVKC